MFEELQGGRREGSEERVGGGGWPDPVGACSPCCERWILISAIKEATGKL